MGKVGIKKPKTRKMHKQLQHTGNTRPSVTPISTSGKGTDISATTIRPLAEDSSTLLSSNAQLVIQAEEDTERIKGFLNGSSTDARIYNAVETMSPLGVSGGGSGAAFTSQPYKQFFSQPENRGPKRYVEFKINLLWVGTRSTGMTGVPWRVKSINEMADDRSLFPEDRFSEIMHVNVGESPLKVDVTKGGLNRVSPPEVHLAYLSRVRKRLQNATEQDLDSVSKSVKHGILDVTARLYSLGTDEAWWVEYNMRDKIEYLRKTVGQTVFQRICGLQGLKRIRESSAGPDAGNVANLSTYMESKAEFVNGKDIEVDDATSQTFVESAMNICAAMNESPAVRKCLSRLDQEEGLNNPLNSIHKINWCLKAGTASPEAMTWLFDAILDATLSKAPFLMVSSLNDFRSGKGGRIPDIIVQKMDFKHHILGKATSQFSIEFTTTLREVFHSHETYRSRWKNINGQAQPSKFLKQWSPAERLVADFVSSACFANEETYHAAYLTGIRHRRSVEELTSHSIFQEQWDNICSLWKEQQKKEAVEEETKKKEAKAAAAKAEGAAEEQPPIDPARQSKTSDGKDLGTAEKNAASAQKKTEEDDPTAYWRMYAMQTYSSTIDLEPAPCIRSHFLEMVKKSKIMEKRPRQGVNTVMIYYDEKLASECATCPWSRRSPARPAYLELVRALIEEYGVQVGFLIVYCDHGKPIARQNFAKMVEAAVGEASMITNMMYDVWYDEESFRKRCRYQKGTCVEAKEGMICAYVGLSLPVNKRSFYSGTNHGRHWGMLVLDPVADTLLVPHGKKKVLHGIALRPGGGPPDGEFLEAADGTGGDKITADTLVPFCWRSFPLKFMRDMVKSFKTTHIFDFTVGSGLLALALLLEGEGETEYFGFCHTPEHVELVKNYLTDRIMVEMGDESSGKLYNPLYAKYIGATKGRVDNNDNLDTSPKKKAKGRRKPAEELKKGTKRKQSSTGKQSPKSDDTDADLSEDDNEGGSEGEASSSPPASDGEL